MGNLLKLFLALGAALLLTTGAFVLFGGDKKVYISGNSTPIYGDDLFTYPRESSTVKLQPVNDNSDIDVVKTGTEPAKQKTTDISIPQNVTAPPDGANSPISSLYDYKNLFLANKKDIGVNIDYADNSYNLTYDFAGYEINLNNADNTKQENNSAKNFVNALGQIFIDTNSRLNKSKDLQALSLWVSNMDASAKPEIEKIAETYLALAEKVESIETVPKEAKYLQNKISSSYRRGALAMGDLLTVTNSSELIDALIAYNKTAEDMAKAFVAVKDYIDINNLEFRQAEPGSIFVLSFGF